MKKEKAVTPQVKHILYIDDDRIQSDIYIADLRDRGYAVHHAGNGEEALTVMDRQPFSCIVLDIRMPAMDGIDFLKQIGMRRIKTPIIIHTAYSSYRNDFITWTADAYITKSLDSGDLVSAVERLAV